MDSIGVDSITNQVATRHIMNGLSLNVLVLGPTGIGKTALINSLFDIDFGDLADYERSLNDVTLRIKEFRPPNKTIKMRLTIMESKGFNNQMDKSTSYKNIVDYIEARFEDYLKQGSDTYYNDIADTRVHCCIYMIKPEKSGLKSIDLATMKQLYQRVCLIPVIGKADRFTKQGRHEMLEKIRQQIALNGIETYSPNFGPQPPFAVSASNDIVEIEGKRRRIRSYAWGHIDIGLHSEFIKLKELLLSNNMLALVEHTDKVHYERYRKNAISSDCLCPICERITNEGRREEAKLLAEIEECERIKRLQRTSSPYKRNY